MKAEELKNSLINYNRIHKWYDDYKEQIKSIEYELEGVKGIRYDKPLSTNTENKDQKRLRLIEQKTRLQISNQFYKLQIEAVNDFISWLTMPSKQIIIDKYINEMADADLETKYGYERTGIWKMVNKKIKIYTNR